MNADTSWKTVPNLTSKIADKLRDEAERTTIGNVKNFVQALQEADLPEIRKKLKSKFTVIDASQIKAWEALLRNGIMNSTDKVFTECLDTEKKFRDLEELQNYSSTFTTFAQLNINNLANSKQIDMMTLSQKLKRNIRNTMKN